MDQFERVRCFGRPHPEGYGPQFAVGIIYPCMLWNSFQASQKNKISFPDRYMSGMYLGLTEGMNKSLLSGVCLRILDRDLSMSTIAHEISSVKEEIHKIIIGQIWGRLHFQWCTARDVTMPGGRKSHLKEQKMRSGTLLLTWLPWIPFKFECRILGGLILHLQRHIEFHPVQSWWSWMENDMIHAVVQAYAVILWNFRELSDFWQTTAVVQKVTSFKRGKALNRKAEQFCHYCNVSQWWSR